MEGNRGKDLGALGLLAAAVVALFWPAVLMRETFFVQDVMVQNYPFRHFFAQALKEWTLPLWNPAVNCGFPLFAEGQVGLFYPFNLITYLLFSTHAALDLSILFHYWLAGVGTYLLLRLIGSGRVAGLVGGLVYACGGYLVIRGMSPNYVGDCSWLPLLFAAIEAAFSRRRSIYFMLAGLVVGVQFLIGHPQAAVYGVIVALGYGFCRALAQKAGWEYWVWIVAGIPAIGGAIAAVQLLPTAELVGMSARGGGLNWEQFVSMSLPPERLITLLLPDFFGNSANGSYWGREAGFFIQLCAYVGILPLLLALQALRNRRDFHTGFFGLICGAGLVLSLGRYISVFDLLYELPGFNFFRIPTRFLLWFALGVSVLAGLGLDDLLSGNRRAAGHRWWWVLCGMLVAGGGMIWINREALSGGNGELLSRYGELLREDGVRLLAMLGAAGWMFAGRGNGWKRRFLEIGVPVLVFVDLYSFGRGFNGLIDASVYTVTPESAKAIVEDAGGDRVVRPRILSLVAEKNSPYEWHAGWTVDTGSYRAYPATLRMYTGGLYGLENALPGWSPLHLRRHWEFVRGYMGFADLAGVEYVINYGALSGPGLKRIYADGIQVYRNEGALPRAYVVEDYRVITGDRERFAFMRSRRFDPRSTVVLEKDPGCGRGGESGSARIAKHAPEEVVVEIENSGGGILVLSETYYPGWRAYVDGEERPILRANHVFRAVCVPAGAREAVFRYRPFSFRAGAWISGLSGLGLILIALAIRKRRMGALVALDTGSGFLLKAWTLQGLLILLLHGMATRWPLWVDLIARSHFVATGGGG